MFIGLVLNLFHANTFEILNFEHLIPIVILVLKSVLSTSYDDLKDFFMDFFLKT